jgi:hypothetical protein
MAFQPEHFRALADKLGKDVADELDKLHEAVFPTKVEKPAKSDDTE